MSFKVIGLTGGIGSGKTTVSNYIREKGHTVIDADEIGREITGPNGEALPKIREAFGDEVFDENGELKRKVLGNIVFNDPAKLKILEEITTKKIVERFAKIVAELKDFSSDGLVIFDAPTLFESGADKLCDETWLVTCDVETRVERVMARDGLTEQEILDRINNQMDEEEKLERCSFVIVNNGGLTNLYAQVDDLLDYHDDYKLEWTMFC